MDVLGWNKNKEKEMVIFGLQRLQRQAGTRRSISNGQRAKGHGGN
jgi:hypothetical protein